MANTARAVRPAQRGLPSEALEPMGKSEALGLAPLLVQKVENIKRIF